MVVSGCDVTLHRSLPANLLHSNFLLSLCLGLSLFPQHRHLQLLVYVVFTACAFGFFQICGGFVMVRLGRAAVVALNDDLLEEFVGLHLVELLLDRVQLLLLLRR